MLLIKTADGRNMTKSLRLYDIPVAATRLLANNHTFTSVNVIAKCAARGNLTEKQNEER
jgi:hypothetical protein